MSSSLSFWWEMESEETAFIRVQNSTEGRKNEGSQMYVTLNAGSGKDEHIFLLTPLLILVHRLQTLMQAEGKGSLASFNLLSFFLFSLEAHRLYTKMNPPERWAAVQQRLQSIALGCHEAPPLVTTSARRVFSGVESAREQSRNNLFTTQINLLTQCININGQWDLSSVYFLPRLFVVVPWAPISWTNLLFVEKVFSPT